MKFGWRYGREMRRPRQKGMLLAQASARKASYARMSRGDSKFPRAVVACACLMARLASGAPGGVVADLEGEGRTGGLLVEGVAPMGADGREDAHDPGAVGGLAGRRCGPPAPAGPLLAT